MSSVLTKHKRQPKIFVDIPSQFRFVKEGTSNSTFKEVPVYSMSGADELMMKNPEALLSGLATKNLIKSCIPSIVEPGNISIIDIEFLLVAIRIASYGEKYNQHSSCPHCGEGNKHEVHLGHILESLSDRKYLETVKMHELTFKLNPLTYDAYTAIEKVSFETQRLIAQTASQKDLTVEQQREIEYTAYKKLNQVIEESIAGQVVEIITPDGSEYDPAQIRDFILTSDREYFELLKKTIEKNNEDQQIKPLEVKCGECAKGYTQFFTMDDSSFFGS